MSQTSKKPDFVLGNAEKPGVAWSENLSQSTQQGEPTPWLFAQRPTIVWGTCLGRGKETDVFEAELQRSPLPPVRVALKRLVPARRGEADLRRNLRREGLIGSQLVHDHVVRTLEVLELADEPVLAMELVKGINAQTLLSRLSAQNFRLGPALWGHVLHGVFSALHYLQFERRCDRPLAHRDVSLLNVMLSAEGRVQLLDFGSAQEEEMQHGASLSNDSYAMGVCAWELLCGRTFPSLPAGYGDAEMGSLIAFAATHHAAPAWLLLRDCLWPEPAHPLQPADGMKLCMRMMAGQPTRAALQKLLRGFSDQGIPGLLSGDASVHEHLTKVDPAVDLADRLQQAFCATQVECFAYREDESRFVCLARQGHGRPLGHQAPLFEAFYRGAAKTDEGLLCLRSDDPYVVVLDPGPERHYAEATEQLLGALLAG